MNVNPAAASILVLSLFTTACLPALYQAPTASQQIADVHQHTDAQVIAKLNATRAQVRSAPAGSLNEAYALAGDARMCFDLGTCGRGKVDGEALLKEANAAVEAALAANPDSRAVLLTRQGYMLMSAQKNAEATAAFEAVLKLQQDVPTYQALIELADRAAQPDRVLKLCQTARPLAKDDDGRYFLLKKCLEHSHAASVEEGLAWAGDDDIAYYHSRIAQLGARQQRHNEQLAREAKRQSDAALASNSCGDTCKRDYKRCMTFCPTGTASPCGRTCADVQQECRMSCTHEASERRKQNADLNAAERAP